MATINTALILKDLPPAPEGKTGWPWTEQSQPLPDRMSDGSDWTRISIVTPSYNQGQFIEETIRSILLQGYPNLEYIIIDGGSTDNSVEIIKKYEPWLTYWISEKDRGQSHAINKGFEHASGFIRGYLNSDDLLLPNALEQVSYVVLSNLGKKILIMGSCQMGYSPDDIFNVCVPVKPNHLVDALSRDGLCPQPSTFWTHNDNSTSHKFNESLIFCMDYEFWCELIRSGYEAIKLDSILAFYRHHKNAKGSAITEVMWSELTGIPLLKITQVRSFKDKLYLSNVCKRRFRHYLRLEIENISKKEGSLPALKCLVYACYDDFSLLIERPTLGLFRRLLFKSLS